MFIKNLRYFDKEENKKKNKKFLFILPNTKVIKVTLKNLFLSFIYFTLLKYSLRWKIFFICICQFDISLVTTIIFFDMQ